MGLTELPPPPPPQRHHMYLGQDFVPQQSPYAFKGGELGVTHLMIEPCVIFNIVSFFGV